MLNICILFFKLFKVFGLWNIPLPTPLRLSYAFTLLFFCIEFPRNLFLYPCLDMINIKVLFNWTYYPFNLINRTIFTFKPQAIYLYIISTMYTTQLIWMILIVTFGMRLACCGFIMHNGGKFSVLLQNF